MSSQKQQVQLSSITSPAMRKNDTNNFQPPNYNPFRRPNNQNVQDPFYNPKLQNKYTFRPPQYNSNSFQQPQHIQQNKYVNRNKQQEKEQLIVNNTFNSNSHQHLFLHKNTNPSNKPASFYPNNSLQYRKVVPKLEPMLENNIKNQNSAQLAENPQKRAQSERKKNHIMSCGHSFEVDTLHQIIQSPQNQKTNKLRCPYPLTQGVKCNQIWEFGDISKLQLLTEKQLSQLQQKLTANLLNKMCKKCPKCSQPFHKKLQLRNNRIVCQKCKFGEFCYLCLREWKQIPLLEIISVDWDTLTESGKYFRVKRFYCGDEQCYTRNYELKQNTKRQFRMIDRSSYSKDTMVKVSQPVLKKCPFCGIVNENKSELKHVDCRVCTKQFCWICLAYPSNDVWPCGKASDYCGIS